MSDDDASDAEMEFLYRGSKATRDAVHYGFRIARKRLFLRLKIGVALVATAIIAGGWYGYSLAFERGFAKALESSGERAAERIKWDAQWMETRKTVARQTLLDAERAVEDAKRELAVLDPYSVDSIDLFSPAFYALKREEREKVLRAALDGLKR